MVGQSTQVATAFAGSLLLVSHGLSTSHRVYRVSSKTVPTWLFALLSASTHANCKSWVIYEKFRKFATR